MRRIKRVERERRDEGVGEKESGRREGGLCGCGGWVARSPGKMIFSYLLIT